MSIEKREQKSQKLVNFQIRVIDLHAVKSTRVRFNSLAATLSICVVHSSARLSHSPSLHNADALFLTFAHRMHSPLSYSTMSTARNSVVVCVVICTKRTFQDQLSLFTNINAMTSLMRGVISSWNAINPLLIRAVRFSLQSVDNGTGSLKRSEIDVL